MINIYYTKTDESINFEILDNALFKMPEKIANEIKKYKFIEQQQQSFLGKKLLQFALQQHNLLYNIDTLQYHKKGKPFLSSNFDFTISHSGEYVVVALAQNNQLGIDIEQHRKIDSSLFKKYFNEIEWENIQKSESIFFDYWTIKEAAIKCDGRGVEILTKVNINNISSLICDKQKMYYKKLEIAPNYSAAICCQKKPEAIIVEPIRSNLLLHF